MSVYDDERDEQVEWNRAMRTAHPLYPWMKELRELRRERKRRTLLGVSDELIQGGVPVITKKATKILSAILELRRLKIEHRLLEIEKAATQRRTLHIKDEKEIERVRASIALAIVEVME